MSFQETLVSKKQKKQKNTQNAQKPKFAKKNKDCYLQHLYHYHNNKTKLNLSQEYFKVKNCKIPQFFLFLDCNSH